MVTAAGKQKLLSPERDTALIDLVTISHDSIETLRLANEQPDDEGLNDVMHQGERYIAFPHDITWPGEGAVSQTGNLRVANVDRKMGDAVRQIAGTDPPDVRLVAVLASDPDTVEASYARLKLRQIRFDINEMTGILRHPDMSSNPIPNYRVTPGRYPALYRARGL